MPSQRPVVLSHIAADQFYSLHTYLLEQGATKEAELLLNDFLDVVFGDIAFFPERFPVFTGIQEPGEYRMALLIGDFRVIFQILPDKIWVLLFMHESGLFL